MDLSAYRSEIKLQLTGYLLELEIEDATIDQIINSSLREIQRYISSTALMTIPYNKCIDLSNEHINSVIAVYRAGEVDSSVDSSITDPVQWQTWRMVYPGGNMYNFQNYVYNYGAYNTMLSINNTSSTDLAFRYDKSSEKLYINSSNGTPNSVTIEYVPRYDSVEEITSDYWIDILTRMSVAKAKIIVGRIRTKYTQSNALWQLDGQAILQEGTEELNSLRDFLSQNSQLIYMYD